jgi:osmotically-inducible protein OsmY
LSGVLGVINNIKIKPAVTASNVKEKIESALKRRIEAEVKDIRVIVHADNKVTLDGKVHDWDEKWAAWTAALSTPGVKDVEDRLKIA